MAAIAIGSLTTAQADLVRETEPGRMAALSEDDLLDLHARVRRARNKHVGLYRRQGAGLVAAKGARGFARPANRTNAERAEVFELALARVSARIGVVAKAAAAELKQQRLSAVAAAKAGSGPETAPPQAARTPVPSTRRRTTKTTGGTKRDAASQAAGARRQAKRDSR